MTSKVVGVTAEATETTQDVDIDKLSDEELVALARKELPYKLDAYKGLLRRHEGLVFGTCVKMLGSKEDAEEVCQDAFLQVFHKLHQFEGRSSFKTWLFRIVYNFCFSRRAAMAKRRERDEAVGEQISVEAEAERGAAMFGAGDDVVREALDALKEDERRLLVMRFVTGLSIAEIAEVLEIKLSAAKMRLYRTLEEFKRLYTRIKNSKGKGDPL